MSVIIDSRLDMARARQVVTFVDRLSLSGAWLRQPWWPLAGPVTSQADAASLLAEITADGRVRAGLIADAGRADAGWPARLAAAATPRRRETAGPCAPLSGEPGLPGEPGTAAAASLSIALSGEPGDVARWQQLIGQQAGLAVSQLALPVGAPQLPAGGDAPPAALFLPCAPGRDLAAAVSAAASAAHGRPVLAEVTVSVGRTVAEARARADADELFALAGHPARQGLFGTLEECQATAARLAHAGVTELICCVPLASDLHDVLAQLRSIAIGASVLRPGDPASAPPPPPAGWGGRSDRPVTA
jgi:hypothetical protein